MILSIVISFFCLCLCVFFVFRTAPPHRFVRALRSDPYRTCSSDSDCGGEGDEACHRGRCFRKVGTCDPLTGDWTVVERDGETFLACACRHPDLAGQDAPGGNCDADRVCEPIGRLVWTDSGAAECSCPEGYVSRRNLLDGTPRCVRTTVFEKKLHEPWCADAEVDLENSVQTRGLNPEYLARYSDVARCMKKPCSFDALTNLPLKHSWFLRNWGCVCDPRRGNVGVRIEDFPGYLDAEGYNACVNIFQKGEPLKNLTDVKLYTYYYLYDKKPISFVQFSNLRPELLGKQFSSMLKENGTLQIEEFWPFDYSQYILKSNKYVVHVRGASVCKTDFRVTNFSDRCWDYIAHDHQLENCKEITETHKENIPYLFFYHPICRVESGDMTTTDFYDKKIVSNPLHVTSKDLLPEHLRNLVSNGIELKQFDEDRWLVDMAPTTSDYLDGITMSAVPDYDEILRE